MGIRDQDKPETYDKPSRASRKGGKQKRQKVAGGPVIPKAEPYKRHRFNPREVELDDEDDLI